MDTHERRWSLERLVVIGALAVGVAAGSYGIANAASGSGSSGTSLAASNLALQSIAATPSATGQPWGGQRSDETLLTGSTESKAKQLALAKVPGATVVRVETDADGNAAYEAHLVKADGTPATVYVNKAFEVVMVETGMPGPPQSSQSSGSGA